MKPIFKPILFSTDMVQAILNGTKTQTRRVIKGIEDCYFQSLVFEKTGRLTFVKNGNYNPTNEEVIEIQPKYSKGDILWVRETFHYVETLDGEFIKFGYKADKDWQGTVWKPSIFMPKAACRIFLKITDVRIERLQDITEEAAKAEGVKFEPFLEQYNCYLCDNKGHKAATNICEDGFYDNAFESFRSLWYTINGEDSWHNNPWVWVIEFERMEKSTSFC